MVLERTNMGRCAAKMVPGLEDHDKKAWLLAA